MIVHHELIKNLGLQKEWETTFFEINALGSFSKQP